MRSASVSDSPGVTGTSCTQATTPNVPMPPKRQPLLGQIYGLTLFPDTDRVLLQCGRGFVVTDNKGAGNMLKALASILEVGASSAAADSESWCRTPRSEEHTS